MKKNIFKKFGSRKFIVSFITAATGIVTLFLGDNEVVKVIAGAAMTLIPTVVYCIMEGVVDAKSVKTITEVTVDAAEKLGADDATVNAIEQIGAVGEMLADDDTDDAGK